MQSDTQTPRLASFSWANWNAALHLKLLVKRFTWWQTKHRGPKKPVSIAHACAVWCVSIQSCAGPFATVQVSQRHWKTWITLLDQMMRLTMTKWPLWLVWHLHIVFHAGRLSCWVIAQAFVPYRTTTLLLQQKLDWKASLPSESNATSVLYKVITCMKTADQY